MIDLEAEIERGHRRHHQPGNGKAAEQMPPPARVRVEAEFAPAAYPQPANCRPKQKNRGHEHRAIEIFLELRLAEKTEDAPSGQRLAGPVERRGEERADDNDRAEIKKNADEI